MSPSIKASKRNINPFCSGDKRKRKPKTKSKPKKRKSWRTVTTVHGTTRKSGGLMNAHGQQSQLNLAQTPARANENLRKTAKLLNETHRIRTLQRHMTIQYWESDSENESDGENGFHFPKGNYGRNNV